MVYPVVSELALYSDNPSSNPAEVYCYLRILLLQRKKENELNKQTYLLLLHSEDQNQLTSDGSINNIAMSFHRDNFAPGNASNSNSISVPLIEEPMSYTNYGITTLLYLL